MSRLIIEASVVADWMAASFDLLHQRTRLNDAIPKWRARSSCSTKNRSLKDAGRAPDEQRNSGESTRNAAGVLDAQ